MTASAARRSRRLEGQQRVLGLRTGVPVQPQGKIGCLADGDEEARQCLQGRRRGVQPAIEKLPINLRPIKQISKKIRNFGFFGVTKVRIYSLLHFQVGFFSRMRWALEKTAGLSNPSLRILPLVEVLHIAIDCQRPLAYLTGEEISRTSSDFVGQNP